MGLIETWDVLKFPKLSAVIAIKSINRNMGCIEIKLCAAIKESGYRLIETWDVLKFDILNSPLITDGGLIETWDVLK